jgi:UDP-glucose 4-epimerase
VASPEGAHARDTDVWQTFLDELSAALSPRDSAPPGGLLVLASSAGGVWAKANDRPISDTTPVAPASTYGRAHVAREERLAVFLAARKGIGGIVVRLANLYGPGQSLEKPQGLVSEIGRCVLLRRPVHIYVPLDTARDYLFAEDAGRAIAELVRLSRTEATGLRIRVVASGRSMTISGLLAIFSRVARRRIPTTVGLHSASSLQPLCLSFRPSRLEALGAGLLTPLEEGVARLFREQVSLLEAGRLSSPETP